MRKIKNDQAVCLLGVFHRERPRDNSAPVVAHDDRFLSAEMLQNRVNIFDQLVHRVVFDSLGLVALVVAALINRHYFEVLGKGRYLLAPAIPEIWKPMDHDQQSAFAFGHIVQFHTAGIYKTLVTQFLGREEGRGNNQQDSEPPDVNSHIDFLILHRSLEKAKTAKTRIKK